MGGGISWSLTGNGGTDPAINFLGRTDNQALELRVNNIRSLRLEPTSGAGQNPNIIGGHSLNSVDAGVEGATITGGGQAFLRWPLDPITVSPTTTAQ